MRMLLVMPAVVFMSAVPATTRCPEATGGLGSGCTAVAIGAEHSQAQPRSVKVNGAELHYTERGRGAPLVFVHGALEDSQSWGDAVLDSLAQHYRVVTYSRRYNHPNKNALSRREFSAATEASDLAAFIRELKLGPVHLVGHSFGGLVALSLATREPRAIRSLVLTDPAVVEWLPALAGGDSLHRAFRQSMLGEVREAFQKNDQDKVLRATLRYFAGEDVLDAIPPAARNELERNLPEWKAIAFAANPFAGPSRDAVRRIRVPTLLVTGDATLPLLRPTNDELERVIPQVKRVRIPQAPHELWQARPTQVRQAVLDFLRLHDAG